MIASKDAGTVGQRAHQLGRDRLLAVRPPHLVTKPSGVVDQDVVHHVDGEREAVWVGALRHDPDELVEVAVGRP